MATTKKLTMDDLMKQEDRLTIRQLRRGDIVEGTIIEINEKEALIDVGAKSEGVIHQSELKGRDYSVGDTVLVYVMTPEDRRGQMVVSLRRAEAVKNWIDLETSFKEGTTIDFTITGHNRGGLIGDIKDGLAGFVPFSHSESAADLSLDKTELQSALDKMRGMVLKTRVIELDREKNRIILSEKEAAIGEALEKRREGVADINAGDLVKATVTAVMPYGLLVKLGDVEGLVPREEVAWDDESIDETLGSFEMGQEVDAQVIDVDNELGKVKISLKSVATNPWEELSTKFKEKDTAKAAITRITSYGVFASISGGIEGMIPLSSIPENEKLEIGREVNVVIKSIDAANRRLDLEYVA